jgi:RNA recognition motif-containing protein
MDIFIGNLSTDVCEKEVYALFAPYGKVASLILNKLLTFGFVKMENAEEAAAAISALKGQPFLGRKLIISRSRGTGRYRTTRRIKLPK